jgi:hypothetical protein
MKSACIALSEDRVMPPQKALPMEFERAIGAFRVQPDWYEEYWLRPNKAAPCGAERRWRWNLLFYSILSAAMASTLVTFLLERNPGMLARRHSKG